MIEVTNDIAYEVEKASQPDMWEFLTNCSLPRNRQDEIQDTFAELCRQMIVGDPSPVTVKLLQQAVSEGASDWFKVVV